MFEKRNLWYIECRTGCTCCSNENFYQGFYQSEAEAQAVVDKYNQGIGNPLASQYAPFGRYSIHQCEGEILPDGRVIVGDSVFSGSDFIGVLYF